MRALLIHDRRGYDIGRSALIALERGLLQYGSHLFVPNW